MNRRFSTSEVWEKISLYFENKNRSTRIWMNSHGVVRRKSNNRSIRAFQYIPAEKKYNVHFLISFMHLCSYKVMFLAALRFDWHSISFPTLCEARTMKFHRLGPQVVCPLGDCSKIEERSAFSDEEDCFWCSWHGVLRHILDIWLIFDINSETIFIFSVSSKKFSVGGDTGGMIFRDAGFNIEFFQVQTLHALE